jgi:hypothetical protein
MDFTEYFLQNKEKIEKDCRNRFVVILGSGIHKEAFGKSVENSLTSWRKLLELVEPNIKIRSSNYILEFERIVTARALNCGKKYAKLQAHEIEDSIKKEIADKLSEHQQLILDSKEQNYPIGIFNPKYVSDVIILNFDMVIESLLLKVENSSGNINRVKNPTNEKYLSARYRTINTINFWHPHGDVRSIKSIILGIRKYGMLIGEVEKLRQRFKANELNPKKNYHKTWIDVFMTQPVIIAGASFSESEWDLWFALVNRMRNFSKNGNRKFQMPIFKMQHDFSQGTEFFEAILESTNQWRTLEELLNN